MPRIGRHSLSVAVAAATAVILATAATMMSVLLPAVASAQQNTSVTPGAARDADSGTALDPLAGLPRVASINLCSDQLLLGLADPEQILTVSWLAADPDESVFAEAAGRFPLNYGTAEELIRYQPDVVLAGTLTGDHTRSLLERLGVAVVALPPADTLAEVFANLRITAEAIGQQERGRQIAARMRTQLEHYRRTLPNERRDTVVVRPGGFTVGEYELADELMTLAGLRNVAAAEGLDRWGSLAMETLLRSAPQLLIFNGYRVHEPSLANSVLQHPALARIRETVASTTIPTRYWACGLPESLDSIALMRHGAAG